MMPHLLVSLALLLLVLCSGCVSAFQTPQATFSVASSARSSSTTYTALNVFGSKKKKTEAEIEAEAKFWQGEWVCKDCGYIYNRVSLIKQIVTPVWFS